MTDKKCHCGARCWAAEDPPFYGECGGNLTPSEEYPGEYLHYCEKHGHPDDWFERASKMNADVDIESEDA